MRKWLLIIILASILLGACASPAPQVAEERYYHFVDPRFREIYIFLHWEGESILRGEVSSLCKNTATGIEKQYFENGILVYDPKASQFYLESLDIESIPEYVVPLQNEPSNARKIDGYLILEDFASLYDEYGERWLGKPATSTLWNSKLRRFEQYFENIAMFRFENDPPGVVHFMSYGRRKYTAHDCQEGSITTHSDEIPTLTPNFGLARIAETRLGYAFIGQVVLSEYQAEDGKREVIFENVVAYADPDSPIGVSLRPLARLLDVPTDSLESPREGMSFRAIEDGKGYNIPDYFNNFIHLHSGHELSGEPITRLQDMGDGVWQQCFANYCLKYDSHASSQTQVSLLPLGIDYKATIYSPAPTPTSPPTPVPTQVPSIELGIWVLHDKISTSQSQIFGACAFEGDKLLQDYVADLRVFISSDEKSYPFSAPNESGCTYLTLPPIVESNGTTIEYQVCITTSWGKTLCEEESFLIWENP